jgi:hypothetical protein
VETVRLDPDRPDSGSLLALASAAATCDAMLTADVGRADMPHAAPARMPWVTWVTTHRVPLWNAAHPDDALLLADETWRPRATEAGWPAARVRVASWPQICDVPLALASRGDLAIVADTVPLEPPERLGEYSSHLLLWDRLRTDIAAHPFGVGDDPERFLDRMMRKFGVAGEGLDRRLFVGRLIVPAYQQGLAGILLREKLPVRLHGAGWDRIEMFREHSAGAVDSPRRLKSIARDAAAFVHVWPGGHAHPIDALGRPVVRRRDADGRSFVSDAMRAMAGRALLPRGAAPPLSLSLVMQALTSRLV